MIRHTLPIYYRPVWRRFEHFLLDYKSKFLSIKASPEQMAGGLALDVFVALLPIVPLQSIAAIGLSMVFRTSKSAALLGTLISNPISVGPQYLLSCYIGKIIMPADIQASSLPMSLGICLQNSWELFVILLVGGLVLAVPAAFLAYTISIRVIQRSTNGREIRSRQS